MKKNQLVFPLSAAATILLLAGSFYLYSQKKQAASFEVEENKNQIIDESKAWRSGLGSITTLNGTAQNAKEGAVLIMTDNTPLYIENLPAWPENLLGKNLSATGELLRNKFINEQTDQTTDMRAGITGEQWVLRGSEWQKK